MSDPQTIRVAPSRRLFWGSAWLAVLLAGIKAYHLGIPAAVAFSHLQNYVRSLAAISYVDVVFAASVWAFGRLVLYGLERVHAPRALVTAASITLLLVSAMSVLYSVANMLMFGIFGGFLTYPLLALVGSVRMLGSSVKAFLTARVLLGLAVLPLSYIALVEASVRLVPSWAHASRHRRITAIATLAVWVTLGQYGFTTEWAARRDRKVSDNPQWILVSSWWQAVNGGLTVRMNDQFAPGDLDDFEPLGSRTPRADAVLRTIAPRAGRRQPAPPRPPNVVLVVAESVGARWTNLDGGPYDTTPNLVAEARRGLVAGNFYAHIGRSSNSLLAILLSAYPKLDFKDVTAEYPHLPGTSLAALFGDRGYRTSFITSSDLSWASWSTFLEGRGFGELQDMHGMPCTEPLTTWGVEDRCMVEAMMAFIDRAPAKPFFIMGWTTQTHHPYEPTPGLPLVEMVREPGPDQYDQQRYLNTVMEDDRQLARLFTRLRERHLDNDTLVVIVGDHGQSFGYPHPTYGQATVYEEDVRVPLLMWFPRRYRTPARSNVVGSHIDLAPTIAELAGLPAAPDWQGRSLFDPQRSGRAYFYAAQDRFTLGAREGRWKYIYDLRQGAEELYDLESDPNEQLNVAAAHADLCARLRQRLAAWTEANRRQYGGIVTGAKAMYPNEHSR